MPKSHKGLVLRDVEVKRGGKTFTQKRWVKPGEDEPEPKKSKKDEVKGKGKYNIGDKFNFLGNDLAIEKVSESEKTVKLSDGKVYTFEAIDKGSKLKDEEKPSKKDLKPQKKAKEKEIKRKISIGTVVTAENAEETLKIGSRITVFGKSFTITNRNESILETTDQDGNKQMGSVNGFISMKAKTRKVDAGDDKLDKLINKKQNLAQKKIEDREKRFSKDVKPKQIGAKSEIIKPEIGTSIEVMAGKKSKIESITPEGITIDGSMYEHEEIHEILNANKPLVSGEKATGTYNFTNDKKQDKKISETINKLDNLMLDGKSLNDSVKEVIGGKEKTFIPNINFRAFDKDSRSIIKDSLKRTNECISSKYKESGLDVNIVENTTGRSYAISERNEISLHDGMDMDSTLMHEIGHLMENNHGDNHKVVSDFLRSRTNNISKQEKLDDLFPGVGYKNDEITSKDDFIDAYVGKINYKQVNRGEIDTQDLRSSEVLSMGMQKFIDEDSMRDLYLRDKSHFALTLSVMAGDFL